MTTTHETTTSMQFSNAAIACVQRQTLADGQGILVTSESHPFISAHVRIDPALGAPRIELLVCEQVALTDDDAFAFVNSMCGVLAEASRLAHPERDVSLTSYAPRAVE